MPRWHFLSPCIKFKSQETPTESSAEEMGGEIEFISTGINDRKFVPALSVCFFLNALFALPELILLLRDIPSL